MIRIVPVTIKDAKLFVAAWHRHHMPSTGALFALGIADDDNVLRGVALVSRPVARAFQDGMTAEVARTATDGVRNGNSMLYGAAWRAARALGYRRLVTYTHADEPGTSLRAAGWRVLAERPARGGWDVPSRPRDNSSYLSTARYLWEAM